MPPQMAHLPMMNRHSCMFKVRTVEQIIFIIIIIAIIFVHKFRKKPKYVCIGEEGESLKLEGGEEIQPSTECTYLGTKIDQLGDNTTEIKHKISQTRKAINALNSIWWQRNITKNRKLYIYQTMIQSI